MLVSAWLVHLLPLISLLLIPLVPEKKRTLSGWIASVSMFLAFLLSLNLAWPMFQGIRLDIRQIPINWITLSDFTVEFGLLIDPLSVLMLLVVTGVGSAIFYYSMEYMGEDEAFKRYFGGLSLFAFSMIGIVLSENLLQLFIFWELVGLSSYLLIGHWYQKPEAADAGKKAFLTNRVGDFGFLIGILLLWTCSGPEGLRTLNLTALPQVIGNFLAADPHHQTWITLALLFVFLGVVGKSAQFPLHVWLPDAMEGPTPVSALIHAATMVAAGVYLLARMFPLFALAPFTLPVIAYVGALTALLAATQALVQRDIKRILAYSTVSQLGLMVMAVGLGGPFIAMYHLTTHAFFKALLFLSAGSILHASSEPDIFRMGGLIRKMPVTSFAFFIGAFALIGFWPSSGFFSKDEILALALAQNRVLFWAACVTVIITALYMGRAVSVAFFGHPKIRKKLHEPTQKMILPITVLAIFSLAGGMIGVDTILEGAGEMPHVSTGAFVKGPRSARPPALALRARTGTAPDAPGKPGASSAVMFLATGLGLAGFLTAFAFHRMSEKKQKPFLEIFSGLRQVLARKYYMDDLYDFILRYVQQPFAQALGWFEKKIIVEGAVNQSAGLTAQAGFLLRKLQTGRIQTYLTIFFGGAVIMIYFLTVR